MTADTAGGQLNIKFDRETPLALFCLFQPDTVAKIILASVRRTARLTSEHERDQKTANILRQIAHAERQEETVIHRLADVGVTVPRRPDARPSIILGVKISGLLERVA